MNIVRCPECNHPDHEHEWEQFPKMANCSFGWCPCSLLRQQVRDTGTEAVIDLKPAYNHATGKWAS